MTGSVTSSEILIFWNLKLHSSTLVSKSASSLFKVFMFLRTRCAKLKMCELIIQGFPYCGVIWESPYQPKICSPSTCKNSPQWTTTTTTPHPFTRKVNFRPLNKVTQCKIPKASPRNYIFQRGFLVGLYSIRCAAFIRAFEFLNLKIEKELASKLRVIA